MLTRPPKILKKVLPILQWLPNYTKQDGLSDLVSGVTVGLTLIPQSIAYAALAGLGPQYGLYSSLCGGIIYAILGTTPELNIAPTALLSLLTFTYTHGVTFGVVSAAVLLCFIAGIVEFLCGLLRLGFLLDYISAPVIAGFTSAGAITIASSQVKNFLGLKYSAENFMDIWINVGNHINKTKIWDLALSSCCCVTLISMRQLKDYGKSHLGEKEKYTSDNGAFRKLLWFISVTRNAFVVVTSAVLAYILELHNQKPFSLTNEVEAGFPSVSPPCFEILDGNLTHTFPEMAKELGTGVLIVPLIAILGNVAIAKAFARGKVVDASQEMVAVGICNIVGSFFQSMPVNASFSRAALSNASGSRTPLAGFYTGVMVILALTFLTPYFSYIPKATLASVIICAVVYMVEVNIVKPIWNINKIDILPLVTTFIACLYLGIEIGILVGVAVDLLLLLCYAGRPKILIDMKKLENGPQYANFTPTSAILFPSVERVREAVMKKIAELGENCKYIVINCQHITKADFTTAMCISSLLEDLEKNGKLVIFMRLALGVDKVITGACQSRYQVAQTEVDLRDLLIGEKVDASVHIKMEHKTILDSTVL